MSSGGVAWSPTNCKGGARSPSKSYASCSSGRRTSTADGKDLPLVDCPTCEIPVIKLRSTTAKNRGKIFYKCENNVQNDPYCRCHFFKWEEDYVKYLAAAGIEVHRGGMEMEMPGIEV